MTSVDIENQAFASITPGMVIERMVSLISSISLDDGVLRLTPTHMRRASWSACLCPYCSVIKTYVSLKRRVQRVERQYGESPSDLLDRALCRMRSDLSVAVRRKDLVKANVLMLAECA